MSRFLRDPLSVRSAAGVIVAATASAVVVGAVFMTVLDREEYPNVWVAMWWALQTVTTVGYGDVTPKNPSGRIVATLMMLQGIAFLAITTAVITSTFVARAQRETAAAESEQGLGYEQRVAAGLDDVARRLDRVEATLQQLTNQKR